MGSTGEGDRDDQGEMDTMGVEPIVDFLPPPTELELRDDGKKITLLIALEVLAFFEREAARRGVAPESLIRTVLDDFVRDHR